VVLIKVTNMLAGDTIRCLLRDKAAGAEEAEEAEAAAALFLFARQR
jgi:hypothetical protein